MPLGKKPLKEGWQEEATTDAAEIARLWAQSPQSNVGIATGLTNGIVVIDLDGIEAHSWWASQGIPQGVTVKTPSGGSHLYYAISDVELKTSQGELFRLPEDRKVPAIAQADVRAEGGLVVGPGSVTQTGTYRLVGDLSNIPEASPALISLVPEKQTYTYVKPEGDEKVTIASEHEVRQLAFITDSLKAIPREWAPGAGWHDTVYRSACWLSRMVNHPQYATTEDSALTILLTYAPTYPDWPAEEILRQWESAKSGTVGQYADVLEENRPDLLPFLDVVNELPDYTTTGGEFTDIIYSLPEVQTSGALWDRRINVLLECFRAGLTEAQAATIAWGCKAATELQVDPHGITKLWREVETAKGRFVKETGDGIAAPAPEERPALELVQPETIALLTDDERAGLQGEHGRWWGTRYMEWAEAALPAINKPYHRSTRWIILAIVFAPIAAIYLQGGIKIPLTIYAMMLGLTTSGKSQALQLLKATLRVIMRDDRGYDLGGNGTAEALLPRLIERDGKSSWFHADEAHGQINKMKSSPGFTDLESLFLELYDGGVPIIHRRTQQDVSGIDAYTYFSIHYTGVPNKLAEVLEGRDWESGWLNRFVYAIGDKPVRTRETMRKNFVNEIADDGAQRGSDPVQRQWASEFDSAIRKIQMASPKPAMRISTAVQERHLDLMETLDRIARSHPRKEALVPTYDRLSTTILKAACLIALSEGTVDVTLRHLHIAIEQGEEWVSNALYMISRTTESDFRRQVDDLERYIAHTKGRRITAARIYTHLGGPKWESDKLIDQLVAEGRISKMPLKGGGTELAIKDRLEAMAA